MMDESKAEIAKLLQTAQATKWADGDIKAYWQALSNPVHYGKGMEKWIPDYAYVHGLLLDTVAMYLPPSGRVLDLGAGSGRISKMVLERFPDCQMTLIDASENMLQATTQTLAAFPGRYELVVGDFLSDNPNANPNNNTEFPPESFDCIVSVFAICHGREISQYERLYANLYRWLKPSGAFVCYDHVCGANEQLTVLNVAGWQEFMLQFQPKEQVQEGILSTYQEDYPLSLHQHLTLLTEAGFPTVDVLFKRDILGLYTAIKA